MDTGYGVVNKDHFTQSADKSDVTKVDYSSYSNIYGLLRSKLPSVEVIRQKGLTFPGRKRTNQGMGGIEGTYVDGDSVTIRVGVLEIDDIALGTVKGEVYNKIATEFIKESPYARTMMVTIAN